MTGRPTPACGGVQEARGGEPRRRKAAAVLQGTVLPAEAVRGVQSEAAFQRAVEQLAAVRGWICWHDHDSRRNEAGFPDLLLIRERVVWIECKAESGRLSVAQVRFLGALHNAGQEVYVARPSNLEMIEGVLA